MAEKTIYILKEAVILIGDSNDRASWTVHYQLKKLTCKILKNETYNNQIIADAHSGSHAAHIGNRIGIGSVLHERGSEEWRKNLVFSVKYRQRLFLRSERFCSEL